MRRPINYSLTSIITVVIIMLIIPINILIIVLSNQMVDSIEDSLNTSYRNELAIYMTQFDGSINELNNKMNEIVQNNWYQLSIEYDESEANLRKYDFWIEMSDLLDDSQIGHIAFLKTNWDQDVRISYKDQILTYKESVVIADFFSNEDLSQYNFADLSVVKIDNHSYLMKNINLYNYSFGVLIDVERVLKPLYQMKTYEGEHFFMVDEDGYIVHVNEHLYLDNDAIIQRLTYDDKTIDYTVIQYPSNESVYSLARIIPEEAKRTSIPFIQRIIQVLAFSSIIIIPVMWLFINYIIIRPLRVLDEGMSNIETNNLEYRINLKPKTKEFNHLYKVFNSMTTQIKNLTIETYEKDIENLEIETTNLRLQMNPHMILNSLNMIYSFAQSNNVEYIKRFSIHLVEYFRYVLKKDNLFVSIREEMNFIKNYLEIQRMRFPGAFTSVYDVDESLFDEQIPPLIIQNFVENAIKYGLKMGSEIEIIIIIRTDGENLTLAVCDTGNGMEDDVLAKLRNGETIENNTGTHIGIWNCRRRLKVLYENQATMTITSTLGEGTQIWMEIPLIN